MSNIQVSLFLQALITSGLFFVPVFQSIRFLPKSTEYYSQVISQSVFNNLTKRIYFMFLGSSVILKLF